MAASPRLRRVNDFAFKMGTVNGTGSASANTSAHAGHLPHGHSGVRARTSFRRTSRASPPGTRSESARTATRRDRRDVDLVVALNHGDVRQGRRRRATGRLSALRFVLAARRHADSRGHHDPRHSVRQACASRAFEGDRNRTLLRNIVYVGALAALLEIDMDVIGELLAREVLEEEGRCSTRTSARSSSATTTPRSTTTARCRSISRQMDATKDSILLDGNSARALGAVYAGATVGAWYPITPSTSLMEAFKEYCERFRDRSRRPSSGSTALIQAEDELAAAGMVIGAGWCGARSFTSTAGPGISLMSEFIGLAYYTEIPGVFFDIQRTGPSTGMPTRTQQGDLLSIAYLSHGDTKHIALFPANPEECFYLGVQAFDLAERFQTPVFVVSDLDIGMNDWMCPRFTWDDAYRPDRGKVLGADGARADQALLALSRRRRRRHRRANAARRRSARRVFHARLGTRQTRRYTEDSAEYQEVVDRLARKLDDRGERPCPRPRCIYRARTARRADRHRLDRRLPRGGARGGRSSCAAADCRSTTCASARSRSRASVRAFLESHPRCYVVEQNRDGQLRTLIAIETGLARDSMTSILDYGGLPLTADRVVRA